MDEAGKAHLSSPKHSSKPARIISVTSLTEWSNSAHVWQPPTDVYETGSELIVQIEIAGMREAEFIISLEKRLLIVSGERPSANEPRSYYQMEIPSGEFLSIVELPKAVDYENGRAEYEDGFLIITFPILKPNKVDVS